MKEIFIELCLSRIECKYCEFGTRKGECLIAFGGYEPYRWNEYKFSEEDKEELKGFFNSYCESHRACDYCVFRHHIIC